DHDTELAASRSSVESSVGRVALTAGLKKVFAAVSRKTIVYTCHCSVVSSSASTSTARTMSEMTNTALRGKRSITTPATGARSTTGTTSKNTVPATARLEPVRWYTHT